MKRFSAAAFGAAFLVSAGAWAQSGSDFLTKAAQGDNSEIMLGKLAEQQGGSSGVKQFGTMLVKDHTKAKKQVDALASSMNATPATGVMPEAQNEHDKLAKMTGANFDKEFASYMVSDHQKDIDDFTKEAGANDGKVSALAKKKLPTLKKHLSIAQSLQSESISMQSMQGMQPPQRIQ